MSTRDDDFVCLGRPSTNPLKQAQSESSFFFPAHALLHAPIASTLTVLLIWVPVKYPWAGVQTPSVRKWMLPGYGTSQGGPCRGVHGVLRHDASSFRKWLAKTVPCFLPVIIVP